MYIKIECKLTKGDQRKKGKGREAKKTVGHHHVETLHMYCMYSMYSIRKVISPRMELLHMEEKLDSGVYY